MDENNNSSSSNIIGLSYNEEITRCHEFEFSDDNGITGVAISVQGRGHWVEKHPCEDYSGVNIKCKYPVFTVADGHSCCSKSEYGSCFAVESVVKLVKNYDDKGLSEFDFIRFFRNKHAFIDLLDIWFKMIYDREAVLLGQKHSNESLLHSASDCAVSMPEYTSMKKQDKLKMAEPYGTTLLTAIICPNVIICFAIGDGGFFLMNRDYVELVNVMGLCDFQTIGDSVNTSMCDLSENAFFTSVYPRNEYNGLLLMTDGLEKPWIDTGRFEKINELREKVHDKAMDVMLYDFIIKYAHPVESDDVSIVFGEF